MKLTNNAPEAGKMDSPRISAKCKCGHEAGWHWYRKRAGEIKAHVDACAVDGCVCLKFQSVNPTPTPAVVSRDQWDDMDEELAMANARIVDLEGREKQLEDALREARKFASENAAFGLVERIDRALSPSASKKEE
jgi:hypothetical protein